MWSEISERNADYFAARARKRDAAANKNLNQGRQDAPCTFTHSLLMKIVTISKKCHFVSAKLNAPQEDAEAGGDSVAAAGAKGTSCLSSAASSSSS